MQNYYLTLNAVYNGKSKPVAVQRLFHADTLAVAGIIVKERLWQVGNAWEVLGLAKLADERGLRRLPLKGGGYAINRASITLVGTPVSFVLKSYHLPVTVAVEPDREFGRGVYPCIQAQQAALVSALLNLNMGFGM